MTGSEIDFSNTDSAQTSFHFTPEEAVRLALATYETNLVVAQKKLEIAESRIAELSKAATHYEKSLKIAAIRLEILTARMRGCNAETGKHELLDEAEAYCSEALCDLKFLNRKWVESSHLSLRFYEKDGWTLQLLSTYCLKGGFQCHFTNDINPYFTPTPGTVIDIERLYDEQVSGLNRTFHDRADLTDLEYMKSMGCC